MTNMIERVARAIRSAYPEISIHDPREDAYQRIARAAIAAMREPTMEMVAHAIGASAENKGWGDVDKLRWYAMIDAALGDAK